MLRAIALASVMSWHLATLYPRNTLWRTLQDSHRWWWSLYRPTSLWTLARRPSHVHRSTSRSYDKGGRTSHHLRQSARRSTLRPVHVTQRVEPRVAPARSCTTSWTGGMIPHSSFGLAKTSPSPVPRDCSVREGRVECFDVAFLSWTTPRNRRSTETSGQWWKPPPFNRWRAPHHDSDSRPLSPPREWGRTR